MIFEWIGVFVLLKREVTEKAWAKHLSERAGQLRTGKRVLPPQRAIHVPSSLQQSEGRERIQVTEELTDSHLPLLDRLKTFLRMDLNL